MAKKSLRAKVEDALRPLLGVAPSDKLELEDVSPNKVGGTLVASKFRGLTHAERQDLIWDALDAALTPHERTRIVIIVANTPEEHKVLRKGA